MTINCIYTGGTITATNVLICWGRGLIMQFCNLLVTLISVQAILQSI